MFRFIIKPLSGCVYELNKVKFTTVISNIQDEVFSGAFEKLRKVSISFVMSVRPSSVRMNNSAPTKWIFMKFDNRVSFENTSRKFKAH